MNKEVKKTIESYMNSLQELVNMRIKSLENEKRIEKLLIEFKLNEDQITEILNNTKLNTDVNTINKNMSITATLNSKMRDLNSKIEFLDKLQKTINIELTNKENESENLRFEIYNVYYRISHLPIKTIENEIMRLFSEINKTMLKLENTKITNFKVSNSIIYDRLTELRQISYIENYKLKDLSNNLQSNIQIDISLIDSVEVEDLILKLINEYKTTITK